MVSGGTAALDSAIEKKFAKKQKLLEANQRVLDGAIQYPSIKAGLKQKNLLKAPHNVKLEKTCTTLLKLIRTFALLKTAIYVRSIVLNQTV
ncbi:MAG: hypothetical protein Ct9H300mP23_01110 [Nitrospinota bacterium]|nr:MAG: hypothetical protein Ct9H300mP23_01110 [Nitrospinota bacterium]